jgi:hypothetical protein
VATATIARRLGTLRMFFVRIEEWGWDEAPPWMPMFPGDLPRQDHPLPRALDDGVAARLLRAAQNDKRQFVVVEQISLDYRYLGATQKAAVAESAP